MMTRLTLGAGSDITFTMASDNLTIAQTTQDKDIIFTVNDGGTTTTLMTLDGHTGRLELPSVGDLRVKGNLTVDGTQTTLNTSTLTIEDNIIELNRNISSNAGMPNYSGLKVNRGEASTATEQDLFWVWDETFADDGTTIHGNAGGAWTAFNQVVDNEATGTELEAPTLVDIRANIVHATATAAQYADLAERYATDTPIEAGEVVILGGQEEITKCMEDKSDAVFGVVSECTGLFDEFRSRQQRHTPSNSTERTCSSQGYRNGCGRRSYSISRIRNGTCGVRGRSNHI